MVPAVFGTAMEFCSSKVHFPPTGAASSELILYPKEPEERIQTGYTINYWKEPKEVVQTDEEGVFCILETRFARPRNTLYQAEPDVII